MKDRKAAKEGGADLVNDPMKEMRERYARAVSADIENRRNGVEDFRFVAIPGNQWDEQQRKRRRGRPCYEFPLLRSHWRQVTGDQKQARPQIKIRAVEDGDVKGAELRQGLIRNIEDQSKASVAYDTAFEWSSAAGFGAWRIVTEYSQDDGWDQDLRIKEIPDALSSVWWDPSAKERDCRDANYWFVEESIPREEFKRRWPKADPVDFQSEFNKKLYGDWCGQDDVRVVEYWRKEPVTEVICLLSDGRTMSQADCEAGAAVLAAEGITVVRQRTIQTHKVVMSLCTGAEEISGPHEWPGKRIPIIPVFGDRYFVDGKWVWSGMVRHAKDAARLVNYNITTGQEILAKQHKATPVVTLKMLEGAGVKEMWDASSAMEAPYLPISPDPMMPSGPSFLTPPPVHAAFAQFGSVSIDLLKSVTGIHDASLGARSNETSGKAIIARQREGDTATFSYQDGLAYSIQSTGEVLLELLPHVYDTERVVRVLGKDGGEAWEQINQQLPDGTVLNDMSAGKYDASVSTGPSFSTQRQEFADLMLQMASSNPALMQIAGDLVMASLDFPKAEEVAERLKLMLPPPIQQAMAHGKELPPEVQQAMQQIEQQAQELQAAMQELQGQAAELEQDKASVTADKAAISAQIKELNAKSAVLQAEYNEKRAELENMQLRWELSQARAADQQRKAGMAEQTAPAEAE